MLDVKYTQVKINSELTYIEIAVLMTRGRSTIDLTGFDDAALCKLTSFVINLGTQFTCWCHDDHIGPSNLKWSIFMHPIK